MKKVLLLTGIVLSLSCAAPARPWKSDVVPDQLRCEYRENPMGIDSGKSRLSWKLETENLKLERGIKQTAYQVLVASTPELLAKDQGDLWDSGKVVSDQSFGVAYAGTALQDTGTCIWKVRVWTLSGKGSDWSKPATYTAGLRAWQGRWIGATDQDQAGSAVKGAADLAKYPHAAILLRKEIKVDKPVKRALVAMSGLGWSELSLNGKKVGDAVLSPQFSDYNKRVPYVMYDVTGLLRKDANAVGVILGNGFSATPNLGYLKWYGNGGKPRLLFQMTVDYDDGTRQTIVSDESWKWSLGEITFNDLWVGEHVDARLAQPGWDRTGFKDSEWHSALGVSAPRGELFARTIPPIRVLATAQPVKIEGNRFIFDTIGAGWLRLRVKGQAGDKITVHYIDTQAGHESYGRELTTEFICKGGGEEVFEPKFLFHTIDRVVTVDGLRETPTLDTLTRCAARIDLPRAGSFECSHEFLNRQYNALLLTQLNYNYDYPMDPTREKSGWTQDVMTMINSSVYDFDTAAFYWNWWQDMRVNQRADGYLGSVVPLVDRVLDDCNCVWWSGMIVHTPWKLYEYYGDRRFIEESYPAMVSYVNWLATKADADKVVAWGLGDWIEVGSISAPQRTSVAITSTCGYYYYATILSQSAARLGKADESATYARLAEEIKAGFNRRFLNTQTGQVGSNPDTQTAQIVPLYFGMVPEEHRQRVIDRLVANIHERKDHVSTGFIGTLYLLLGLPELGQAELTHTMVMQQDYPGWNTLVKDEVQMETWGGGQVQMPSLGGPIGAYLYQVLGGIRPDPKGPGFKKIIIKPAIVGNLTWVKAHYDSLHGRIVSDWQREGDKLTMDVTIPVNTTATVYVPAKDAAGVTESGKPAGQAEGVKFLRMENAAAVYEVGSGCYRFCSAK